MNEKRDHDVITVAEALGYGVDGLGKTRKAQAYWKGIASSIIWAQLLIKNMKDFDSRKSNGRYDNHEHRLR